MATFIKAQKNISEEIKEMFSTWFVTEKDHEDFTEYLFKNRIKDRRPIGNRKRKRYR